MKKFNVAIGAVAVCVAASAFVAGCGGGSDEAATPDNGVRTIEVGVQVPQGSPLDTGSEHLNQEQLAQLFVGIAPRMMVMCHANDPLTIAGGFDGGASGDYNVEEVIATGSLKITANADGTLTATASDYISPNGSGLVWKFVGYRAVGGHNPVVQTNPYVIPPNEQKDTFHAYWNSYQPLE